MKGDITPAIATIKGARDEGALEISVQDYLRSIGREGLIGESYNEASVMLGGDPVLDEAVDQWYELYMQHDGLPNN